MRERKRKLRGRERRKVYPERQTERKRGSRFDEKERKEREKERKKEREKERRKE